MNRQEKAGEVLLSQLPKNLRLPSKVLSREEAIKKYDLKMEMIEHLF